MVVALGDSTNAMGFSSAPQHATSPAPAPGFGNDPMTQADWKSQELLQTYHK